MINQSQTVVCSDPVSIGIRLDKFLFSQFPEYSRSYFQELIDSGCILINQKPASKSNYSMKLDDQVTITFKIKQYNFDPVQVDFEVIDEQQDFIVINKPAGLVVHNGPSNPSDIALVNGLLYRYQELNELGDKERPGIVHRLDKNTSGLIIVARNRSSQIEFSDMFKKRLISKTYLALVDKHPSKSGKIDLPVGRHPIDRHKMSTIGIDAKEALSYYTILAKYEETALLSVKIVTGRTHQIRVHCAAIGHGLIGDAVYGHPSKLIGRQALHSWKMSFTYRDKEYSYTCPVPEDFKRLLATLNRFDAKQ